MTWSSEQIGRAICVGFLAAKANYQKLNELDGVLGDGDLGETVYRCADSIDSADLTGPIDGMLVDITARIAGSSGSSLATVLAVACGAAAAEAGPKTEVSPQEAIEILDAGLEGILALGQVKRGDKTVVDALYAIRDGLFASKDAPERLSQCVRQELDEALASLRDQPFKVGRGRVYSNKKGIDDPGMVALSFAIDAIITS